MLLPYNHMEAQGCHHCLNRQYLSTLEWHATQGERMGVAFAKRWEIRCIPGKQYSFTILCPSYWLDESSYCVITYELSCRMWYYREASFVASPNPKLAYKHLPSAIGCFGGKVGIYPDGTCSIWPLRDLSLPVWTCQHLDPLICHNYDSDMFDVWELPDLPNSLAWSPSLIIVILWTPNSLHTVDYRSFPCWQDIEIQF